MQLRKVVRTAVRALRRNLLRAVLTTLGIVIGIAAVIAMVEIGKGSATAIQRTISSMGANVLIVQSGTAASGGVSFGGGSEKTLTAADADAIIRECPSILDVAPIVRSRSQLVVGNKNWVPSQIYGTTPSFLRVKDWEQMSEGEMFGERDVRSGARVAVIGKTIANELFPGRSPVGEEMRIGNVWFKVIGVLGRKGANMMGMDQDDIVLAPWSTIKSRVKSSGETNAAGSTTAPATAQSADSESALYPGAAGSLYPGADADSSGVSPRVIGPSIIDQIHITARSAGQVAGAIEEITALLRERHRIQPHDVEDFSVRDMTEMTKALTTTSTLMTRLLLAVALISLIVGGVGIMNIMLVSVTERTKEIGLRMALGARPRDVLRQFLVEAIVLCVAGGVFGIVLGRGASWAVSLLLKWPVEVSLSAAGAAVGVSVFVGVVFGYYPAWKASRMDPIEALRYE